MLSNRSKNIIKVAILCMAVSLLSFTLGARFGNRPLLISGEAEPTVQKSEGEDLEQNLLLPIAEVMKMIQDKYAGEVDGPTLVEGAIKGMVDSLEDPYSLYMGPKEFEDFMISVNGSFSGVGIALGIDDKGNVIVVSPVEDTPAQKAGILPRDRIVRVDDIDIVDKSLDEVVSYIRGEKGTQVTLYIQRGADQELLRFDLVRDDIRQRTIKHEMLAENVGYLKITSFDSHTYDDFVKAVGTLKKQGMEAMILDLRNNPGGSLHECILVADEILGQGLVAYTEDRHKNRVEEFYSDEKKLGLPLVVLVNENSASASEIVAGAIQDHEAGLLVGTKTFGKGSVQELEPFENGAGIKITIAKYYIPSGRSIDGVGIEPDVPVPLEEGLNIFDVPRDRDTQLGKALEVLETIRKKEQVK